MYRLKVYQGVSQLKPAAYIEEVEEVKHGDRTLYRDVNTGHVESLYRSIGESVFATRAEAVAEATKQLELFSAQYAEVVRAVIDGLGQTTAAEVTS
jgi:hypothetical protein